MQRLFRLLVNLERLCWCSALLFQCILPPSDFVCGMRTLLEAAFEVLVDVRWILCDVWFEGRGLGTLDYAMFGKAIQRYILEGLLDWPIG